jgi:hypothetical protein
MADAYQKETDTDSYLLEDGTGVYLLEIPKGTIPGTQFSELLISGQLYGSFASKGGAVAVTYPQLERGIRGVMRGVCMGSY